MLTFWASFRNLNEYLKISIFLCFLSVYLMSSRTKQYIYFIQLWKLHLRAFMRKYECLTSVLMRMLYISFHLITCQKLLDVYLSLSVFCLRLIILRYISKQNGRPSFFFKYRTCFNFWYHAQKLVEKIAINKLLQTIWML